MKNLIPLLLILTSCSEDSDPCKCNKIVDAVTFQHVKPNGIEFETVITTVNVCDSTQTQLSHHHTQNSFLIPKVGECYK